MFLVLVYENVEPRKIIIAKMKIRISNFEKPSDKIFALVLRVTTHEQTFCEVEQMILTVQTTKIFSILYANNYYIIFNSKMLKKFLLWAKS